MLSLSFFAKKEYDICPARYEARYVLKMKGTRPDSRNAYEGSVWHLLMENWMNQPGEQLPPEQWLFDNVDKYIQEYLLKERVVFKSEIDRALAREKIIKMVKGGLECMKRESLLVKGQTEYVFRNASIKGKVKLNGRIDLVHDYTELGFVDILDYKGVGKYAGLSYEQLCLYRYAGRQEFGVPVRRCGFILGLFSDFVLFDDRYWPESRLEEEFLATAEAIEARKFPFKPSSFNCKDCIRKDSCPEAYDNKKHINQLHKEIKNVERNRNEAGEGETGTFRVKL